MAYNAKIILDSKNAVGDRLTTFEITYPRFVHSEFMTHRLFSRNAASSRAIPIEKVIKAVCDDPVLPVWWGKNQSGMQAKEELSESEIRWAKEEWLHARGLAVSQAEMLTRIGMHKQIVNRILEPWCWITVIVTATDYENFFAQRCHPDAQPELQQVANMMRDLYYTSKPDVLPTGAWHMPYVAHNDVMTLVADGYSTEDIKKISVARCARVSYLTHDGVRDPQKDIDMFDTKLLPSGHWSPFEHVACADPCAKSGNFIGFQQFRKSFGGEMRTYEYGES